MKFFKNIKKSRLSKDEIFCSQIKKILGFRTKNIGIYKNAFTHPSLQLKDKEGNPINFERLEYLGDSILGAIIANYLYQKVKSGDEGYLTQMRSKIVNREHLNELGKDLDLIQFLHTSIPASKVGPNVHGNIFEAFIGAIFIDKGYDFTAKFVHKKVIIPYVDIQKLEGKITSYKGVMIEWAQKNKKTIKFEGYEDSGNQNVKHFSVKLYINSQIISKGRATSKKRAEEMASKRAYYSIQESLKNN